MILKVPYTGECGRKAYEFGILAAQETQPSRGTLIIRLLLKGDRFQISDIWREQASGDEENAEKAVEQLLRQILQ